MENNSNHDNLDLEGNLHEIEFTSSEEFTEFTPCHGFVPTFTGVQIQDTIQIKIECAG